MAARSPPAGRRVNLRQSSPAGAPAIRLRHSGPTVPAGPWRGYAPSRRCDRPANEYRGAQDVQTAHKTAGETPLAGPGSLARAGCRLK